MRCTFQALFVFALILRVCYIFLVMKNLQRFWNERRDGVIGVVLFVLSFALYVRTLAPSVAFLFDDTLEFQYVVPRLGIIHQTGYPFYALLGKLFTLIVPLNDPAFRLNLLSALDAALAVAMVYLVARHLVTYRFAAIIAALTFAVGQTFWSQAVIAETYSTQMLMVAVLFYLALIWREEVEQKHADQARRRLYALAFVMGLGLAHHRLILLLYPAITFYVLLVHRDILRELKTLVRAALLFLAPLLFYLYLPLRGAVGSADGTYQNTLQGFFSWVMASQYFTFLTSNPFHVQRDAAFYETLFNSQLGVVGLALAGVGIVWLLRKPREWALLIVALIPEAAFAFNYHVANVYVHFLTTFLLLAVFAGAGADGLFNVIARLSSRRYQAVGLIALPIAGLLLLSIPANLLFANYATNDLSAKWDIHDYGIDILNLPLEKNATIIGITGEMTLLRYFQENAGIRPDVQTIAADDEAERMAAIENAITQNRVVYLTRPLKGVEDKYSLSSFGPLIRVNPNPVTTPPKLSHPLEEDFGAAKLLGYDLDSSHLNSIPNLWHADNSRFLGVTLYWQVMDKITDDATVSVKILRSDQHIVGQIDHRPVLDAYPTTAWRKGEIIADTYAVPLFLGITPSDYTISVTMYDAKSGIVIGQHELQKFHLGPDATAPRRAVQNIVHASDEYFALSLAGYSLDDWNVAHLIDADFGILSLAGYSLAANSGATVRPGDALPLTLLWHGGATKLPDDLVVRVWLEDSHGDTVASRDAPISVGYPPFQWQNGAYVRDWPVIRVPANVGDGKYTAKLAVVSHHELLGSTLAPFDPTIVKLGQVEIKNRARVMTAPAVPHSLEAVFDKKIKLLGYDLVQDVPARGVRLTLYWKSLALMETPYTVFVHLIDGKDNILASADSVPGNGDLPTTGWIEEEYITDIHAFTLPPDLPDGGYPIEIGLYDPATGVRLKTADGHDRVVVASINQP